MIAVNHPNVVCILLGISPAGCRVLSTQYSTPSL
jgi:hypothetical protein